MRDALAVLALAALAGTAAGATPAGPAQCEALARAALPMARELIELHGEFAPFGVGLNAAEEAVEVDPARQPGRPPARDALRQALGEALESGVVEATALVYEATVDGGPRAARGDAIAMQLVHRDGYRAVIVYPYRLENGAVVLEAPQVIEHKTRSSTKPPVRPRVR